MPWIELHENFREHPKVSRLASLLGITFNEAQSYLVNLWLWCVAYARDGNITGFNDSEIALACRSTKLDPKKLIAALIESRFIDLKDSKKQIHDWKKHGLRVLNQSKKRTSKYRAEKDLKEKQVTQHESNRDVLLSILSLLSIPSSHIMYTPAFEETWLGWCTFRSELRKPLKAMTVRSQLKFLSTQGDPIAVIEESIRNGWQGLFPIRENYAGTRKSLRPDSQIARATFSHGDAEKQRLAALEESLRRRDAERGKRS